MIWDTDTAALIPVTGDSRSVLGMSANGDVLYAWLVADSAGAPVEACVTVVPLSDLDRATKAPATCHPATTMPAGALSPDGTAAFLDGPAAFRGMHSPADLRAGRGAPPAPPPAFDGYHVASGYDQPWSRTGPGASVVLGATDGGRPLYRYALCDPSGACAVIRMPGGLDRPVPVAHLPG
jgi:hypothetical protein